LREVLAAGDHDFVLTEPASKLNHLREKLRAARRRGSRRTGRRGRRYFSILAAGFFVATAAAILLNALVWQRTRHPAPLFVRAAPITSSLPHDGISQLLKAPPAPPGRAAAEAAVSAAPSKLVLAAQRALVKLGFVLTPDGVAGATTRQAIEHYERDHGLPVRGVLSRAIMRKLSAETGITIN
jgi:hypothetical protein